LNSFAFSSVDRHVATRLFLADRAVERFVASGRAALDGAELVARGGPLDGRRFALEPAVRVVSVVDGGAGAAPAGRVRLVADLRAAGAELVGSSLVEGDAAYEVEHGYVATPDAEAAALLGLAQEQPPFRSPQEGHFDAESLARFLLNTLS
jgi:hypothetical protein